MPDERQQRAWDELGLGPRWILRKAAAAEDAEDAEDAADAADAEGVSASGAGDGGPRELAPEPDSWEAVRSEVSQCRRCGLCESRRQTVFGRGSLQSRWMLIGEAPGAEEDAQGEPFVGMAGQLLDQMLASIRLSPGTDVFITNVLKCRPPGNRNPEPLEARTCSTYLHRQIELLQPDLILLLGRFAAQSVLDTDASIASLRQRIHHYRSRRRAIPVVCTYHPAYLLRNLPDKRKSWEDLCLAQDVAAQAQAALPAETGTPT